MLKRAMEDLSDKEKKRATEAEGPFSPTETVIERGHFTQKAHEGLKLFNKIAEAIKEGDFNQKERNILNNILARSDSWSEDKVITLFENLGYKQLERLKGYIHNLLRNKGKTFSPFIKGQLVVKDLS